jgi:hypothetical protein
VSWDQARDAKVPQIPQMTCLVEVLEERETSILGEEVHEIPARGWSSDRQRCLCQVHRVSVVLPDDGERLTQLVLCGVDGVRCWHSGH